MTELEALLDALWQTLSRAGSLSLERCLAWQLEGVGQIFVNQLVALLGQTVELFMVMVEILDEIGKFRFKMDGMPHLVFSLG